MYQAFLISATWDMRNFLSRLHELNSESLLRLSNLHNLGWMHNRAIDEKMRGSTISGSFIHENAGDPATHVRFRS